MSHLPAEMIVRVRAGTTVADARRGPGRGRPDGAARPGPAGAGDRRRRAGRRATADCAGCATDRCATPSSRSASSSAEGKLVKAGRSGGQERDRLRPVPAAGRVARARWACWPRWCCAASRCRPARQWFVGRRRRRPLRPAPPAVPPVGASCGTAARPGSCSKATPTTWPTRPAGSSARRSPASAGPPPVPSGGRASLTAGGLRAASGPWRRVAGRGRGRDGAHRRRRAGRRRSPRSSRHRRPRVSGAASCRPPSRTASTRPAGSIPGRSVR